MDCCCSFRSLGMYDDLATLFHDDVLSAYRAYIDERETRASGRHQLLSKAVNLSRALFHFREHLNHLQPADGMKREEVEAACPDNCLIGDVANASKHGSVQNRTPHGDPLLMSAGDVYEVTVVTHFEDADGPYT